MIDFLPNFTSPLTAQPGLDLGVFAAAFHKGSVKRLGHAVATDPVALALYEERLLPALEHLPASPECWMPELGAMLGRMNDGRPAVAVMQSLMALHVVGVPGAWSAALAGPERFSVQGYLFTLSGNVSVDATGNSIDIVFGERSDQHRIQFDRAETGWRLAEEKRSARDAGVSAPAFIDVPGFTSTYVQGWLDPTAQGVRDPVVEWPPERLPEPFARLPAVAAVAFRDVFSVLEESGAYLDWIRPLFRGAVVSPPVVPGRSYSSSHVRHAGVFSCVYPYGTEELGETVVHEMSHQYFLMLNAIFPMTNPGDDRLYYSSLKGSARTLDRVLLAYHAAANMTLYWQDRIRVAGWTERRAACLQVMSDHSGDLASQLETSDGLSETGAKMFGLQNSLLMDRREAA